MLGHKVFELVESRIAMKIKDCTISVTCGDVCGNRLCILSVHGKDRVVTTAVDVETVDKLITFLRKAKKMVRGGGK